MHATCWHLLVFPVGRQTGRRRNPSLGITLLPTPSPSPGTAEWVAVLLRGLHQAVQCWRVGTEPTPWRFTGKHSGTLVPALLAYPGGIGKKRTW